MTSALSAGVDPSKIYIGIPFYGRGWHGVSPGPNNDGLFQSAVEKSYGMYELGVDDYKAIKTYPGTTYYDTTALAAWKYDANTKNFWSFDNPTTVVWKSDYVSKKALGGMMTWSLDGDSDDELLTTMRLAAPSKTIGGYFPQWAIYRRAFYPKNLVPAVSSGKINYIQYAFANMYEVADANSSTGVSYQCDGTVIAPETSITMPMPDPIKDLPGYQTWLNNAGKGGDRWAEVGKGFTAAESVDGVADDASGTQKLAGLWNQFKKLKAVNSNLKVYVSLGGWSYSKFFSKAAATDYLRQKLVSSCIDLYIKGNVPKSPWPITDLRYDSRGGDTGANVGANVFDGIDIDWEAPGTKEVGQPYNNVDTVNDKQNFVLLLAEFRRQLDLLTTSTKRYGLSAALFTGSTALKHIDFKGIAPYLDKIQLMSYDYHGPWDLTMTGHHSPVYNNPKGPNQNQ